MADTSRIVAPEARITSPYLTSYEKSAVLSQRTRQLSDGAPYFVDISKLARPSALAIAELELKQGKMPLTIDRTLPNGDIERWSVSELKDLT